jgi:OOP family OmpA-OmpF porin
MRISPVLRPLRALALMAGLVAVPTVVAAQTTPDAPSPPAEPGGPPSAPSRIRSPGVDDGPRRRAGEEAESTADARPEAEAEASGSSKARPVAPSPSGETGLIRVASARTARARTIRVGFGLDFFATSGVFADDDSLDRFGGLLSLSGSPIEHLELWLNLRAQSTGSSLTNPQLLQAQGDLGLGVKGSFEVGGFATLGADAELRLLSGVGESSYALDSSQFRLRALATADLEKTEAKAPVVLHANFGVMLDGSENLASANLSDAERFALGIDAFNRLAFGLGIEIPVKYVTPYLEYSFEVPLGYLATPGIVLRSADASRAALRVAQNVTPAPADPARPSIQRAIPQRLTPGIRVTAVPNLALDLAVEIGLTPDVAPGVAATPPYNVIMMASYTLDPTATGGGGPAGPPVAVPVLVPEVRIQEVEAAKKNGFVMGKVTSKDGAVVDGAVVSFDRAPPVATAANGRFLSHEVEPGPITMVVSKPGFLDAKVEATVTAAQTVEANLSLEPAITRARVAGRITGSGRPLAGARVIARGAKGGTFELKADADGRYALELEEGSWVVLVEAPGHLRSGARLSVADADLTQAFELSARGDTPAAERRENEIVLASPIGFAEGEDTPSPDARKGLDALVDFLLERPALKVRIESHVDAKTDEAEADRLTRRRAEKIVADLVAHGVEAKQLVAVGKGSSVPRAPNLTTRGRALNRRVEIHVE